LFINQQFCARSNRAKLKIGALLILTLGAQLLIIDLSSVDQEEALDKAEKFWQQIIHL